MIETVLRSRRTADTPALAAALEAQRPASGYPVREGMDPATFVVRPHQVRAWVAEVDGRLAGHVALAQVSPTDDFAAAWSAHHEVEVDQLLAVSALFVASEFLGRGLGGRLFDHAVAHAVGLGRPVVLDTVERPSAALAMYERRGWRVVARAQPDWLPDGRRTVGMVPPG